MKFVQHDGLVGVRVGIDHQVGDQHGLNTLEHQPVKVMAMEGHFESHKDGAPLYLFGWPDQAKGELKWALGIPKFGSLILKHQIDAPMAGLDTVPRQDWPPVPVLFWSFRIMVGLGFAMLAAVWVLLPFLPDWRWLLQREDSLPAAGTLGRGRRSFVWTLLPRRAGHLRLASPTLSSTTNTTTDARQTAARRIIEILHEKGRP